MLSSYVHLYVKIFQRTFEVGSVEIHKLVELCWNTSASCMTIKWNCLVIYNYDANYTTNTIYHILAHQRHPLSRNVSVIHIYLKKISRLNLKIAIYMLLFIQSNQNVWLQCNLKWKIDISRYCLRQTKNTHIIDLR